MHIFVSGVDRKSLTLNLSSTSLLEEPVERIIAEFSARTGIPPAELRLVFRGQAACLWSGQASGGLWHSEQYHYLRPASLSGWGARW